MPLAFWSFLISQLHELSDIPDAFLSMTERKSIVIRVTIVGFPFAGFSIDPAFLNWDVKIHLCQVMQQPADRYGFIAEAEIQPVIQQVQVVPDIQAVYKKTDSAGKMIRGGSGSGIEISL